MTEEIVTPLDRLREPFLPEQIHQIPKGGVQLDYVGHAEVTERLLEVDPLWSWEPLAFNEAGAPLITTHDGVAVMWIRLTICGVTRLGVGTARADKGEVEKELIGDALRNASMRFGVALDLWKKTINVGAGAPQGSQTSKGGQPSSSRISDKQRDFVYKLLEEKILPEDFSIPDVETLTRRDASTLIDTMVGFPDGAKPVRKASVKKVQNTADEPPEPEEAPF